VRFLFILLAAVALEAEPFGWFELPPEVQRIFERGGLGEASFADWQAKRAAEMQSRLDAGTAEHIAYFLLQSRELTDDPGLNPAREARVYLDALPTERRPAFLAGQASGGTFRDPIRRRIEAFWKAEVVSERHRVLRGMAERLGWQPERIVENAFRFLARRAEVEDADGIYQRRGLSTDPYPASMRAVERGLSKMNGKREAVLLVGPGAELGSRFGVDDALPVASPQPATLLAMLPGKPVRFDCVDVRREVVASLVGGPCRGKLQDVVREALPAGVYDVAVATNVLVYLSDEELGVAISNIARSLRPGGCLLHNDARFAARLFGEAAGIPVVHFEVVALGKAGGRDQIDRAVVQCRAVAKPD
jgi:SAM-dependent methyltransferase